MNARTFLFALALAFPACTGGGVLDDDDASTDDDDAVDDDDTTPSGPVAQQTQEVSIVTEDGVALAGAYRGFTGGQQPAVLLLHQYGRDRGDFSLLFPLFQAQQIATLALDFRGHGLSGPPPDPTVDLLSDPDQLPRDVEAALAWLAEQPGVDPERVGVMGLSVGANLAVVASHNRAAWGVETSCSVSARLEAIYGLAGTDQLDLASAIYVAADLESPQNADAEALAAMTAAPTVARRVLETSAHGVELLTNSSDVRSGTVAWFVDQL